MHQKCVSNVETKHFVKLGSQILIVNRVPSLLAPHAQLIQNLNPAFNHFTVTATAKKL